MKKRRTKNTKIVKCRICTEYIKSNSDSIEISSKHEYNFHAVTQMELRKSKFLSNIICGSCDEMLEKFADFKEFAIERQQMLHDLILDAGMTDDGENVNNSVVEVIIKAEPVELKKCHVNIERLHPQHLKKLLPSRTNFNKILKQLNDWNVELIVLDEESDIDPLENTEITFKEEIECPVKSLVVIELDDPSEKEDEAKPKPPEKPEEAEMSKMIENIQKMTEELKKLIKEKKSEKSKESVEIKEVKVKKDETESTADDNFDMMCDNFDDDTRFSTNSDEIKPAFIGIQPISKISMLNEQSDGSNYGNDDFSSHSTDEHANLSNELICDFCFKVYKDRIVLRDHIIVHHSSKEPELLCEICSKLFHTPRQIQIHMKRVHKIIKRKCRLKECHQFFDSYVIMKEHYVSSHLGKHQTSSSNNHQSKYRHQESSKEFICDFCYRVYKDRIVLRDHIIVHHSSKGPELLCEMCSKLFHTRRQIQIHMRRVHNFAERKCIVDGCHKVFDSLEILKKHYMNSHPNKLPKKDTPINCPNCQTLLLRRRALPRHLQVCKMNQNDQPPNNEVKCKFVGCPQIFSCFKLMREHYISEHPKIKRKDKPIQCRKCLTIVSRRSNLKKHMGRCDMKDQPDVEDVNFDEEWRCKDEGCQQKFNKLEFMLNHYNNTHPNQIPKNYLPIDCPKCSTRIQRRYLLEKHLRGCKMNDEPVEQTERSEGQMARSTCDLCEKVFENPRNMKRHRIICKFNEDEKPRHECPLCKRCLSTEGSLHRHMKTCG